MFDKKVTLTIPEERKVLKKRIGGREIQIYDSLTNDEIVFCVNESLKLYNQDTFEEDVDMNITPVELYANLDILVLQVATNVDVTDFDFEIMCGLGIHDFLKNNIKGYSLIESAIIVGVQHVHTCKMLEGIEHIATIDELEETTENFDKMIKDGIPENVKDLVMANMVENPALQKIYDELNSMVLKNNGTNK